MAEKSYSTSSVRFIPTFYVFDAIVDTIYFKTSAPIVCLWGNTINFCNCVFIFIWVVGLIDTKFNTVFIIFLYYSFTICIDILFLIPNFSNLCLLLCFSLYIYIIEQYGFINMIEFFFVKGAAFSFIDLHFIDFCSDLYYCALHMKCHFSQMMSVLTVTPQRMVLFWELKKTLVN